VRQLERPQQRLDHQSQSHHRCRVAFRLNLRFRVKEKQS
jgi:hypothetical protein